MDLGTGGLCPQQSGQRAHHARRSPRQGPASAEHARQTTCRAQQCKEFAQRPRALVARFERRTSTPEGVGRRGALRPAHAHRAIVSRHDESARRHGAGGGTLAHCCAPADAVVDCASGDVRAAPDRRIGACCSVRTVHERDNQSALR